MFATGFKNHHFDKLLGAYLTAHKCHVCAAVQLGIVKAGYVVGKISSIGM